MIDRTITCKKARTSDSLIHSMCECVCACACACARGECWGLSSRSDGGVVYHRSESCSRDEVEVDEIQLEDDKEAAGDGLKETASSQGDDVQFIKEEESQQQQRGTKRARSPDKDEKRRSVIRTALPPVSLVWVVARCA